MTENFIDVFKDAFSEALVESIDRRFEQDMGAIFGVATNSIAPEPPLLTARMLTDMMEDMLATHPPQPAMEIHITKGAVHHQQNKVYPLRRAKNESHWRRMNNKWARRYGHTPIPTMHSMPRLRLFSMGGGMETILFIHPDLMKEVKIITLPTGECISDLGSIPVFDRDKETNRGAVG